MQFEYVATRVLTYGVQGYWLTYIRPDQRVYDLKNPSSYKIVYFKIQRFTGDTTPFWVDSNQIFNLNNIDNSTIKDAFLREFDPDYFVPITINESLTNQYVRYKSSRKENIQIFFDCADTFVSPNPFIEPMDVVSRNIPLDQLPDLALVSTRYLVDMSLLHSRALVSINGLFHPTILSDETDSVVYVKDAGKTSTISGTQFVGFLHFEGIPSIEKVPLSSLTFTLPDNGTYYGPVNISGIETDLTDKQILLSIGGYLLLPNPDIYSIIASDTIQIDMSKIDIEQKIVEASKYIDITSLNLSDLITIPDNAELSILQSDAVIEAFMKLTQSFLVIVPKSRSLTYTTPFRRFENPRKIDTSFYPIETVFSSTGRLIDYYVENSKRDTGYHNWFIGYQNTVETTRSTIYDILKTAYPDLVPRVYDIVNEFHDLAYS